MADFDRELLKKLDPRLKRIVDAEVALGNEVVGAADNAFPTVSLLVHVRYAFRGNHDPLPAGVEYFAVNDPHWWKGEYRCIVGPAPKPDLDDRPIWHSVACPFETGRN